MLSIRTILHPTAFSDRAAFAFGVACALARDYGARLVVLHVDLLPLTFFGDIVAPPRPERERQRLQEQLQGLRPPDPKIALEQRLMEGDPVAGILDAAHESNADLIVTGTHGRTGLGRLLMGSVAEQTLRRAPCPILTVRTPFPAPAPAAEPLPKLAKT